MKEIFLCSGNSNKTLEFKTLLNYHFPNLSNNVIITSIDIDLPELQGDAESICSEKCKAAYEKIKKPVLVEDTSLGFNAFNGLPGPYIKWFLKSLKPQGLFDMLKGQNDKTGKAETLIGYWDGIIESPIIFRGTTEGTIVEPRGKYDFGWDPIFEPIGCKKTYGEMSKEEKNAISHRSRAVEKLGHVLED